MSYLRCPFYAAVVAMLGIGSIHGDGRDEAIALSQRFVAHMQSNCPVEGEFEIRTSLDPVIYDRLRSDIERMNNEKLKGRMQFHTESNDQLLLCRWAYDRYRELVETKPGSRNVFRTAYMTREATLEGIDEKTFNLYGRKALDFRRPASFYFLLGAERWDRALATYPELKIRSAPTDSPAGAVLLVAENPKVGIELRLLIDRTNCVLYGFESYLNSRLFSRLKIDEYLRGPDQRIFPTKAELVVFMPSYQDRPYRMEKLRAIEVRFPSAPADTQNAFDLNLPAGSVIADRELNRSISVNRPTSAILVMDGKLPSEPLPPPEIALEPPATKRWYWAGAVVFALGGLFVAAWYFRGRKRR